MCRASRLSISVAWDPHHGPIGHGCSQSRHGYINSPNEKEDETCGAAPASLNHWMDEILRQLTDMSVRQQQMAEHLASWQDQVEQELLAFRTASAQRSPLPDIQTRATQLLPKMTVHDDVESFLQMFESNAHRERWARDEWARLLALLLTGEAQRAYFTLPPETADGYEELKKEILGRFGLSSICAAQQFHEWSYKPRLPARAQAVELHRLAQHWLSAGEATPAQVIKRVTIDPGGGYAEPNHARGDGGDGRAGGRYPAKEQHADDRLKHCWTQVRIIEGQETQPGPHPLPYFVVQNGLLYCVAQRRGEEKQLLVVPKSKTETVLELTHSHPLAGHLGAHNTTQRIRDRFHWLGLEAEVNRFCEACPTCQRTSPQKPPPSPLIPLPIIEVPFERIGMDLVGQLPKSARGHEHILVIVDYAKRYPEAVPLCKATAKNIARELFLLFSRVGIPSEILTDQGTPFMSRFMADLAQLLNQLCTSVYHPQTDRLVERFNQTLKQMLRRVASEDRRDWDQICSLTCYSESERCHRPPPGLLHLSCYSADNPVGCWMWPGRPGNASLPHFQARDEGGLVPLVKEPQSRLSSGITTGLPSPVSSRVETGSWSLSTWEGPYTVLEKVGPVTYRIQQPGRR
ncbi:Retrovirus-related Pol polyprotein [Labeo rohita]|uniref:Gypsy retrotransposon integrase-like protein 1 n=1 Tax=Labeo rohita TaxID=84645 RepID=A0ABQ8LP23_LABRO|nr:Retrovirus-related Pol polyprotein [Labeo rohita]